MTGHAPTPGVAILAKACVCGHDHTTHRGELVDMCLEYSCTEYVQRCQNCGAPANWKPGGGYDTCSRRCALTLEYAETLRPGARAA